MIRVPIGQLTISSSSIHTKPIASEILTITNSSAKRPEDKQYEPDHPLLSLVRFNQPR